MASSGAVPLGVGTLTASILLAIMIIPYSASLAREVIRLTPQELKEAADAMGGTRFSVIRFVTLPYSFSGIFAGQLGNSVSLREKLNSRMALNRTVSSAATTLVYTFSLVMVVPLVLILSFIFMKGITHIRVSLFISDQRDGGVLNEIEGSFEMVLLVTHNLSQAGRVSDHAAVFLGGELVEYGPAGSFFINPKDPRTEAYLSGRFG